MHLPLDLADKLINDRVEFKLYAAEQVLDRLRQLEKDGSINSSNIPRVIWEINIECLLAHLVGAVDALLVRINDKLNLGLNIKNVNLATINNKLNRQGKGQSLQDLNLAIKEKCWLWTLKDVRNQGLHRSLINIHVAVGGERNIISLRTDPQTDLGIIPYLEDSINRTRKLIEDILRNEPLLRI